MKTPIDRLIAAFALFFTMALPFISGYIAKVSYRFLVELVAQQHRGVTPPLTQLFYNNFHALLWGLFFFTLVLVGFGAWQWRVNDPVLRLGRVLLFSVLSATMSVVFLGLFLLATALPLAIHN